MMENIPMLPFPYKHAKKIARGLYPVASILTKFFPELEIELEETGFTLSAKEYLSGALLAFATYFIAMLAILSIYIYRNDLAGDIKIRLTAFFFSLIIALSIFMYITIVPKWQASRKKVGIEKNLLFAMRHLTIQTSAGVPFFDSLVSISEEYGDERFNYGAVAMEFRKIVKQVRGGKELTDALEESAAKNPSLYYRRSLWQLANANKAGANIGFVLRDIVEYLSNEQRIMIREYGSQLNTLSLFYMFVCIIGPTMSVIFLAIASTLVETEVNEYLLGLILVVLTMMQIMFIGFIKSRRPSVAP
jgi:pilus assembly protein TadC